MNDDQSTPGDSVAVILARIEVKLDTELKRGEDHEARIRALEKRVWFASGTAGLFAGFVATFLQDQIGLGG